MDSITRQNTVSAEKSADAALDLTSQSENLEAVVGDISLLVGGTKLTATDSDSEEADVNPEVIPLPSRGVFARRATHA